MVNTISIDVDDKLNAYAADVIATTAPRCKSHHYGNLYDETRPLISNDFIQKHPLNQTSFNAISLVQSPYYWKVNIPLPPISILQPIIDDLERRLLKQFKFIRSSMFYPIGGFMGWHTNDDMPGFRVYLTYSDTGNSCFKSITPQTHLNISHDRPGWFVRTFEPTNKYDHYLWHCVDSYGSNRISIGMLFK